MLALPRHRRRRARRAQGPGDDADRHDPLRRAPAHGRARPVQRCGCAIGSGGCRTRSPPSARSSWGVAVIGLIAGFIYTQVRTNAPRLAEQAHGDVRRRGDVVPGRSAAAVRCAGRAVQPGLQRVLTSNQERLVSGAHDAVCALARARRGAAPAARDVLPAARRRPDLVVGALAPADVVARAADAVGRFGWRTLGGFMRGQTIIALLHPPRRSSSCSSCCACRWRRRCRCSSSSGPTSRSSA